MIVIDASVGNKLFLPLEEGYREANRIFQSHVEGREKIIVPDIIFYEIANTLATKTAIPKVQVTKSLKKLASLSLTISHPTIEHIIEAASLAKQHKSSVYDMLYAVLAKEKKCDLITADAKFVLQVKLPFVKTLREYVSD